MLLFFSMMSWTLSMIFIFLKHPLSLGLMVLLQTIIISLISGLLNLNFWFSYILFLIMIGGMLVLFIYMTSIASNEKFKFSKSLLLLSLLPLFSLIIILMSDPMITMKNLLTYDLKNQEFFNIDLSLSKFMNMPNTLIMIILIMYLLITLIAIVKITQYNMGPLRPST